MQKTFENFECFQEARFEFIDLLKNNGTMYLLNFDDSREDIFNSKAFAEVAATGGHFGVSIFTLNTNSVIKAI